MLFRQELVSSRAVKTYTSPLTTIPLSGLSPRVKLRFSVAGFLELLVVVYETCGESVCFELPNKKKTFNFEEKKFFVDLSNVLPQKDHLVFRHDRFHRCYTHIGQLQGSKHTWPLQ